MYIYFFFLIIMLMLSQSTGFSFAQIELFEIRHLMQSSHMTLSKFTNTKVTWTLSM